MKPAHAESILMVKAGEGRGEAFLRRWSRVWARRSTLWRTGSRIAMATVSATEARKRLYALIDEVGQSHEPVQITGKRGNAVLLSEDDWRAIQETLHLVSIPGMREAILEGMATDVSELCSEPGW